MDRPGGHGPIVLVRHAAAGDRTAYLAADHLRPLTAKGEWQAGQIAEALVEFSPARVVSSPAVRCRATVAPAAARCGTELEELDVLAEGSDPRAAFDALIGLASRTGGALVACSHGDVIPGIVELLADRGVPHSAVPAIKKGAMVVIELEGAAPSSMRFVDAPRRGRT